MSCSQNLSDLLKYCETKLISVFRFFTAELNPVKLILSDDGDKTLTSNTAHKHHNKSTGESLHGFGLNKLFRQATGHRFECQ